MTTMIEGARAHRFALGLGDSLELLGFDTREEARLAYVRIRDESGRGYSTLREGVLYDLAPATPKPIAVASFNGRLWDFTNWKADQRRVYDSIGGAE